MTKYVLSIQRGHIQLTQGGMHKGVQLASMGADEGGEGGCATSETQKVLVQGMYWGHIGLIRDPPKGEGCNGGFAAVRARLEGPRGERVGLADEASAGIGIEEGRSRLFRRNVSNGGGLYSPAEELVHEPAADCLCFSASLCNAVQHITKEI